jgi:hypothetical protein
MAVVALASASGRVRAQQPTQAPPPVRALGPIMAVTKDSFVAVTGAVQVSGGRVFVNDIIGHRVVLYDSTLAKAIVVADSTGATANAYGNRPGTLLPFHGDSALLITPGSLSMLVLSPAGTIARTMAMPPAGNAGPLALIGNVFGTPGFDARGRLAYFSSNRFMVRPPPPAGTQANAPIVMEPPDSATIVRFDFASRKLDTAATIRIPKSRSTMNRTENGISSSTSTAFPPQTVDDWAVTSDGSIAVVRGRDYHVDWLNADGTWTSTPRMPYEWERLNDDQKNALLDSVVTAQQTQMDSMRARMERQMAGGGAGPIVVGGGGDRGAAEAGRVTIMTRSGDGGGGGGAPPARGGGPPAGFQFPKIVVSRAELSDVPDYRPPLGQGAVRADAEGNLWIRTSKLIDGRPVYDIVNRKGEVTDRLQLPMNRSLAGFGPGVVYLAVFDSTRVAHLERARVK